MQPNLFHLPLVKLPCLVLPFRSVQGTMLTHAAAGSGHPEDHPGKWHQRGHSYFLAVPGQTQTGRKSAQVCHGHQQHPLGGGDVLQT